MIIKKILKKVGRKIKGLLNKHERIVNLWRKNEGEKLRYKYGLTSDSVVFDVGGYVGQWAEDIYNQYGSNIYIFEPIQNFFKKIVNKFNGNQKIKIYNFGLSSQNKHVDIPISEDASSLYKKSNNTEKIELRSISGFILENNIKEINLIKINIEGEEYNLLDDLISHNLISSIKNFQIQFHNFFPEAKERMKKIQNELRKTHHLTFQYPFVWENWERNE